RPITVVLGLIGPDGRIGLTPMWFDYEGDRILVNTASHRAKCEWIRTRPELTLLIVNPDNPYHWVQIKCTVESEEREWEPAVARGAQLAAMNQRGITLWIGEERTSAPIHATDRPETLGHQDVVLVTLKSSVLPAAASQLQPLIGPETTVVFAMNGIPWWYLY